MQVKDRFFLIEDKIENTNFPSQVIAQRIAAHLLAKPEPLADFERQSQQEAKCV